MPRVLVIGSANVDYTVAAPRLPRPGETVSEGVLLVNHGGKGANQAVAARRLGAEVRFIGCVGDDAAGRGVVAALADEGIDVSGVATAGVPTGTALIVVDAEGRNQIAVAPGANRALTGDLVAAHGDAFTWADVLVCQLETPLATVRWALAEARRHGTLTVLNPAPVPDTPLDLWAAVDYLTPNEGEASRLAGAGSEMAPAEAAERLRARGAGTVVVTLGGAGVLACGENAVLRVPAVDVRVVDTTAAGDAFNGALAVALVEGGDVPRALRFANAAAALACTRRGAQASLPRREEVERLLADGGSRA